LTQKRCLESKWIRVTIQWILHTCSDTEEEDKGDHEAFMTYGNNHVTNLSKQYQHDACGTSEECLDML